MRCTICKEGHTAPGQVTVTLERGDCIVLMKEVPAAICRNCGEYYLTEEVTAVLLERCVAAVAIGAELQVLRWAA